jgi:kumamolisin
MSSHITLDGSHREHPQESTFAGQPEPDQQIQITCVLRRRKEAQSTPHIQITHDRLQQTCGAEPTDLEAVEQFASKRGYVVTKRDAAARTISIAGPLARLAEDFGADLQLSKMGAETVRTRQGALRLPASLSKRVVAVLGFDERPVATTSRRFFCHASKAPSYTPLEVARAYNFPANKGENQTIALIELGGGYRNSDLQDYWRKLKLAGPQVSAVSVDHARNAPTGNPDSADGEVVLDIEVAGAIAPGARIAVYFAPNTDQGFLNAINSAIHDKVRKPSIISISWGGPEDQWTRSALNVFNAAFHDAALLGISVCAASGDNGSADGEQDGANHVDFPASSPWVLACGGTRLVAANGKITSENVWNGGAKDGATGGGVSSHFSKPAYQSGAQVPKPRLTLNPMGRGVPDVAGNADPETGYVVLVDGELGVVGGTSAVAPLWAALIALLNQQLGRNLGWLHPQLYGAIAQQKALHDITSGNNGAYEATTGWDACTGLGTPDGQAILQVLKQLAMK